MVNPATCNKNSGNLEINAKLQLQLNHVYTNTVVKLFDTIVQNTTSPEIQKLESNLSTIQKHLHADCLSYQRLNEFRNQPYTADKSEQLKKVFQAFCPTSIFYLAPEDITPEQKAYDFLHHKLPMLSTEGNVIVNEVGKLARDLASEIWSKHSNTKKTSECSQSVQIKESALDTLFKMPAAKDALSDLRTEECIKMAKDGPHNALPFVDFLIKTYGATVNIPMIKSAAMLEDARITAVCLCQHDNAESQNSYLIEDITAVLSPFNYADAATQTHL